MVDRHWPVHGRITGPIVIGVFLYGHGKNAYWYGSQLSIEETRRIAPYQNATGLQVTSAVLADRPGLFPEDIDESDPWQFRNMLVQ